VDTILTAAAPDSKWDYRTLTSHRLHEEGDCGAQYHGKKPGIMAERNGLIYGIDTTVTC